MPKLHLLHYLKFLLIFMLLPGSFAATAQDFSNLQGQKGVQLAGNIEAGSTMYSANGIANRRQPFSFLVNGNAALNIYGFSIPFSISYTQSQSSFGQPFNQFGMSPTYKWITVHLGYRSLEFSPYTLGGHTMLGVGLELTPGKLRFGFMYGKLNSATKIDTLNEALVPYSFSRKAYAAKLGYGSSRNFFELSMLKAEDDSLSVSRSSIPRAVFIPPAGNTVLGINSRFTIAKNFVFENVVAGSIYTRDLNSAYKADTIKNAFLRQLGKYVGYNGTTEFYTSFNSALGYQGKYAGLKVNYTRIDPEYRSMGAYYINSDVESWTLVPRVSLFKNKIRANGSFGYQHDNLLKQKRSTNKRLVNAVNLSVDVTSRFSIDGSYSNFSNDQQPNTIRYPDSLRIVQTTQNIMLSPRFTIVSVNAIQLINFTATINQLNDLNQLITNNQATSRAISTHQYFVNYAITFPKQNLGVYFNVNSTKLHSPTFASTYQGLSVGGFSNVLKNKLQLNLNNTFTQGTTSAGKSLIINTTGTLGYKVFKSHVMKAAMYYTSNQPGPGSTQAAYTEFRTEVSYLLNF